MIMDQLYTSTTVVLVLQTLYYDYWLRWWKNICFDAPLEVSNYKPFFFQPWMFLSQCWPSYKLILQEEDNGQPLNPKVEDLSRPIPTTAVAKASPRTDVYYTYVHMYLSINTTWMRAWFSELIGSSSIIHRSARSLASSGTPSCGGASYLGVRSGPSEGLAFHDSSSEDEGSPAHHHGAAARKKTTFSRSVSTTCLCVWITFSSG